MNITFFPGSIIGYIGYPEALYTRGLADGLVRRGNMVRIVEERKNAITRQTLETEGSRPARQLYEDFPDVQIHTYDPRTGARLLEWVSRELALIDVAVAVDGLPTELCRWLANVNREGLLRIYLTFDPDGLTAERKHELEIEKFDAIMVGGRVNDARDIPTIPLTIALQDEDAGLTAHIPEQQTPQIVDAEAGAVAFEEAIREIALQKLMAQPPSTTPQNGFESPPGS